MSKYQTYYCKNNLEKSTCPQQSNSTYTGTASDVVGTAKGETSGSTLYWRYDLLIDVDGTKYQITLDDWMYLLDDKRLFNKTDIIKYGIKVGEVILYIEKTKNKTI